jgi:3-hydroxyisobutyrate dehydrogenase-like beta-hydroxyacid dehydrogenase
MRVGIVGTGAMGRPLVDRLLSRGFDVSAFARRTDARAELTETGVHCVDTVAQLPEGRDAVIVYVYSDEQVREVVLDHGVADAMEPGSIIVVGSADTLVQAVGHFVRKDAEVAQVVAEELDAPLGTIGAVITPLLERTRPR